MSGSWDSDFSAGQWLLLVGSGSEAAWAALRLPLLTSPQTPRSFLALHVGDKTLSHTFTFLLLSFVALQLCFSQILL